MKGFVERHLNQNTNQQICDLINEKWDVEITKTRLAAYMAYKNLKRNKRIAEKRKAKSNPRNEGKKDPISEFVANSKITDVYLLRDEIIERFEKNISTAELKKMIFKRTGDSSKESTNEEVRRIKQERADDMDDDVDRMELGY